MKKNQRIHTPTELVVREQLMKRMGLLFGIRFLREKINCVHVTCT